MKVAMQEANIEGKTKIIEAYPDDPSKVRIQTKNVLTGNDAAIKADLPLAEDKTAQTCHVFELLKQHDIPIAYIEQDSDTSFIAHACDMLPLECVARRIPYGSYLKRHPAIQPPTASAIAGIGGGGVTGKWKEPLVEFFHKFAVIVDEENPANTELIAEGEARARYMKADGSWDKLVYTDPLINIEEGNWKLYPAKMPFTIQFSLLSIAPLVDQQVIQTIKYKLLLPCFEVLEKAWAKFDITLVDLKLEVGYKAIAADAKPESFKGYSVVNAAKQELVIADVLDNDSWRIWPQGNPEMQLDKQAFRDGAALTEVQEKYKTVTSFTKQFVDDE